MYWTVVSQAVDSNNNLLYLTDNGATTNPIIVTNCENNVFSKNQLWVPIYNMTQSTNQSNINNGIEYGVFLLRNVGTGNLLQYAGASSPADSAPDSQSNEDSPAFLLNTATPSSSGFFAIRTNETVSENLSITLAQNYTSGAQVVFSSWAAVANQNWILQAVDDNSKPSNA